MIFGHLTSTALALATNAGGIMSIDDGGDRIRRGGGGAGRGGGGGGLGVSSTRSRGASTGSATSTTAMTRGANSIGTAATTTTGKGVVVKVTSEGYHRIRDILTATGRSRDDVNEMSFYCSDAYTGNVRKEKFSLNAAARGGGGDDDGGIAAVTPSSGGEGRGDMPRIAPSLANSVANDDDDEDDDDDDDAANNVPFRKQLGAATRIAATVAADVVTATRKGVE
jgi:hypothetical protein